MKKILLLISIAVCLAGCEKTHEEQQEVVPTRYVCSECMVKPIIHECSCEQEGCQCYDISPEILHKYDDDKDIVLLLVASVKVNNWSDDVYSLPDGYLVMYHPYSSWSLGWGVESIEDFPYEKGYEYLIYAQRFSPHIVDYIRYRYVETVSKTKIQSFNLPEYADEY